jgi:hypothetical protein
MTHSKFFERWYPHAFSVISGMGVCLIPIKLPADEKEFLTAAISIGAILMGFIATAMAILAALPSDSVMGRLRSSGYIDDLVTYLGESLYGCLFFCVYSLIGFFWIGKMLWWYPVIWYALGIFSTLTIHRVFGILLKVLKFPVP